MANIAKISGGIMGPGATRNTDKAVKAPSLDQLARNREIKKLPARSVPKKSKWRLALVKQIAASALHVRRVRLARGKYGGAAVNT